MLVPYRLEGANALYGADGILMCMRESNAPKKQVYLQTREISPFEFNVFFGSEFVHLLCG